MKKLLLSVALILGIITVMSGVVSADTLFEDGFESGNFNNWDEHDDDWFITTYGEHSGTYAAFASDQGLSYDDLRRELSTVGYNNIVFSYWYKIAESIESNDHVYVQWYDGSTWHEVADYTNMGSGIWTFATFSLPSGAINNPDFEIRFRADDLEGGFHYKDKFMLDDVQVTGDAISQECSDCTLDIVNPLEGQFYCQDDILVDWTAEGEDCEAPWNVYYGVKDGDCDLDLETWLLNHLGTSFVTELPWDISELSEGEYCVKVTGACCEAEIEGPICIDCTAPEVSVCVQDTCPQCSEGIESDDEWTPEKGTTIIISYDDTNDCEQQCELECEIDWGDDSDPEPCSEACEGEECYHQYGDGGDTVNPYTITVTVTDCADNEGSATEDVTIENVDPVCIGVQASVSDIPLIDGEAEVDFIADATDVVADIPLTYNWDFGDSTTLSDGSEVSHTYTSAGLYTVSVEVSDKDGGSTMCEDITVDVVDPTPLTDQEVAAYYGLDADFGYSDNRFHHNLSGPSEDCMKIVGPTNLEILDQGSDEYCTVRWDNDDGIANPTNDEQGDHLIVVKVYNDTDYEYYSFTVTVYSWIIDLQEGWNLVSIPYVPEDNTLLAEGVGITQIMSSIESIWSYEYNSPSTWKYYKEGDLGSELDKIVPGRGYWVKATKEAQIKGFGTQIGQTDQFPGMAPEIEVPINHWSLIGRYGILGVPQHFGCYDAGAIPKSTALESLTKLDNELHVYDVDSFGHLMSVNRLFNNKGYWLWVEDEALNNAESETYAPLDRFYREDIECVILR